jgi:hypothetical protein
LCTTLLPAIQLGHAPTSRGRRAIIEVAKPWGVAVHDHIIVGKDGHASPVNPRQSPGNAITRRFGFATVCGSLMQAQ